MKKTKYIILLVTITLFLFQNCNHNKKNINDLDYPVFKKPLREVNKILVDKDSLKITKYYQRMKWDCKISPTGLFYEIYYHSTSDADSVQPGNNVLINYTVSLLNGKKCYTTDTTGPEIFQLGRGVAEQGLEQGLLKMKEGDKAHLILPPHLAYGLIGDEHKIPARSIIIYDVELVKIFRP